MMVRIHLALALVLATACGGGKGECGDAIARVQELTTTDLPKDPKIADRINDAILAANKAMVGRCNDDKWSKDAIACLKRASKVGDLKACEDRLTADQKQSLVKAIQDAMKSGSGAGDAAGDKPSGDQLDARTALAQAKALKGKMCDCLASQCAKDVEAESRTLLHLTETARRDPATKDDYSAIEDETLKCFKRVMEHDPPK